MWRCHPSGRPGLRPHIRLLRGLPLLLATTALLPAVRDIGTLRGAGLTSKAHRDRSTKSRLTWAVWPAPGIGLPKVLHGVPGSSSSSATTDPDGCHTWTVTCHGPYVRWWKATQLPSNPREPLHTRRFPPFRDLRKTFLTVSDHRGQGSRSGRSHPPPVSSRHGAPAPPQRSSRRW